MIKISKEIGPTKILLISLLVAIIIGAFILKLPICNKQPIKPIDSFFVATSATCVTGLTTVVPIEQFTTIGQVVLLILIQIRWNWFYDIDFNCSDNGRKKIEFIGQNNNKRIIKSRFI